MFRRVISTMFIFCLSVSFFSCATTPIEKVVESVQDPFLSPQEKAYHVKRLGKYFPVTDLGKSEKRVAPLEVAQNIIPILIPLLNKDNPSLLYNTIQTLAHIVWNYPKETYNQVRPHIEKMVDIPYPEVSRKAMTALANMDNAYHYIK